MEETIVIIGGGIAGVTTAEEVKKHAPHVRVVLIDGEEEPLYSRVLLPHYIKEKIPRAKVFLRTPERYAEQGIERVAGKEVSKIDPARKTVTLNDDTHILYTNLVLATGTAPRPSQGYVLQTLADADAIVEALPKLQEMHIVGGGFMACEFVNIAEKFHLPAKVYVRGGGFWNTILPEEAQQVLAQHLQHHGVRIHAAEEAPTQHPGLFYGTGAPAQCHLAEQAGCASEAGGIKTTEALATTQPHIFAAGDCAAAWQPTLGRHLRVGNWQNALQHGRALGATLGGAPTVATKPTAYATDLLGLSIIFMGDVQRAHATQLHMVRNGEKIQIYYYDDARLIGVVLINDPLARAALLAALGTSYVPT